MTGRWGDRGTGRPSTPPVALSPRRPVSVAVRPHEPFYQIGGRTAFDKRQTQYFAARSLDHISPDDPVNFPIAALDQYVGQQRGDDFSRRSLVEDRHVIDTTERS